MAGVLRTAYAQSAQGAVAKAKEFCGAKLRGVIVFGSVGRGTPHDGSDIDMLLVIDDLPSGRSGRAQICAEVERAWQRGAGRGAPELSLLARTPGELQSGFPLLLEILADGQILFDADDAVAQILDGWRRRVAAAKARRVYRGAAWHWDLKGDAAPGEWQILNARSLAQSHLRKADVRVAVLQAYLDRDAYSDVVREAQEAVELALKAALRLIGVEPPKVHDVSALLREYEDRLPGLAVEELCRISTRLRKERELAFSGDIDFLPTEQYTRDDAELARSEAQRVLDAVNALDDRLG